MSFLNFKGVGITALSAAVPHSVINNYEYTEFFPKDDVKKIVDKVGIYERRFATPEVCSSDLCFAAAERLFEDNDVNRDEIDLLVFVSQTPDYKMPSTSVILQDRLKLQKTTVTFDINLGCSAFIYGMSIVYSMMERSGLRKALILNGEIRSRVYSPKDRRTAFLFGDAGAAALIERNEKIGESTFSLNSDGSLADLIMIKAGGGRVPSSPETLKEKIIDEYGNIRSDEHGYMNGEDVFNFVIKEVPKDIKRILSHTNEEIENFDYVVFHQANAFINKYIAKKLKIDPNRIPISVNKFGNTSSVSVPLTIVSELKNKLEGNKKLLLSAFGVGMTWASAIVPFDNCRISEIVEV